MNRMTGMRGRVAAIGMLFAAASTAAQAPEATLQRLFAYYLVEDFEVGRAWRVEEWETDLPVRLGRDPFFRVEARIRPGVPGDLDLGFAERLDGRGRATQRSVLGLRIESRAHQRNVLLVRPATPIELPDQQLVSVTAWVSAANTGHRLSALLVDGDGIPYYEATLGTLNHTGWREMNATFLIDTPASVGTLSLGGLILRTAPLDMGHGTETLHFDAITIATRPPAGGAR